MRVAYVCADQGVPVFGHKGCSVHVQELIRAFLGHGAQVEIFAAGMGDAAPPDLEVLPRHALPRPAGRTAEAREESAVTANRALRLALETQGPFRLVYERHSLWSVEAMRFARDCGLAGVLEVNAPLVEEQLEHRTLCDVATARLMASEAFTTAGTIVAVSRGAAEYVERYIGTTPKLHVVPNGVDPSRFALMPVGPEGDRQTFTVGFVGSLKPWHGLLTLARAFAELHHEDARTRLLVVGDGPERGRAESWLHSHGVGHAVQFTGPVPPERVPWLLASMDVAVAPYAARRDFYFSPLKVLEYMAAGIPLVASRLGQIEELVVDGKTGLLCAPDDPGSLAARLRELRDDPRLLASLGAAARSAVVERHTWHGVASRILSLAGLDVQVGVER